MSMEQIRKHRGVPAKRGMRIVFTGNSEQGNHQPGVIVSARGGYLRIRLDGEKHAHNYHPTWELNYLDDEGNVIYDSRKVKEEWRQRKLAAASS